MGAENQGTDQNAQGAQGGQSAQGAQTDQSGVTLEALNSSLEDLVKAADATELLNKADASGIEHTGRVDESGKGGGGRADRSDAGGLDNMMVAKLTEAGLDAGTIAMFSEFVGKQKKDKKDDDEENGDDMSAEMTDVVADMHAYAKKNGSMKGYSYPGMDKSGDNAGGSEPLVKSLEEFRKDSDIADAIDVSPFLEALTANTASQIDGLRKGIVDGQANQVDVNQKMAAALYQVGTLIKSQESVISVLGERLGIVEREPQKQKGATNLSGAEALNKSIPGEAGGPPAVNPQGEQLTKAELLSTLSYMNLEKSIKNIGATKTCDAICLLDGGNKLDPQILAAASDFLVQNPNEAQTARTYR